MKALVTICDYAQVHAGKLYITGAGGNVVLTASAEPPHPINVYAAVIVTVPWTAHNQVHRLRVSLVDEDGKVVEFTAPIPGTDTLPEDIGSLSAQFNAGRSAMMSHPDETLMPLAVPLVAEVPHLGAYHAAVFIDGTEVATARFRVTHSQNMGLG